MAGGVWLTPSCRRPPALAPHRIQSAVPKERTPLHWCRSSQAPRRSARQRRTACWCVGAYGRSRLDAAHRRRGQNPSASWPMAIHMARTMEWAAAGTCRRGDWARVALTRAAPTCCPVHAFAPALRLHGRHYGDPDAGAAPSRGHTQRPQPAGRWRGHHTGACRSAADAALPLVEKATVAGCRCFRAHTGTFGGCGTTRSAGPGGEPLQNALRAA